MRQLGRPVDTESAQAGPQPDQGKESSAFPSCVSAKTPGTGWLPIVLEPPQREHWMPQFTDGQERLPEGGTARDATQARVADVESQDRYR